MERITKRTLFWILALIPLVDFFNGGILLVISDSDISLGKFYRIITLMILMWVLYENSTKLELKKHIAVYSVIAIICIAWTTIFYFYHNKINGAINDIIELSKIVLLFSIVYVLKFLREKKYIKQNFIVNIFDVFMLIFPITMIIPFLLGIGFNTYSNGMGYTGLYYANNDLSIVILVTVIFALDKLINNKTIFNGIILMLNILSLLLIGSKTGLLGVIFALGVYAIVYGLKAIKTKKYSNKKLGVYTLIAIGVLILSTIILFPLIKGVIERVVYFSNKHGSILTALLSNRDAFLAEAWNNLMDEKLWVIKLLFGVGFFYRGNWGEGSLIEMDIFDMMFSLGLVFVVVLIVYFIKYLILNKYRFNIKNLKYTVSIFIVIGFSTLAGHVVFSALAGSVFALVLSGFFCAEKESK